MDDIYNQKIIFFAAEIPHIGTLGEPNIRAKAVSRLCGSAVEISLRADDKDRVEDFAMNIQACILGQASASIVARQIIGSSFDELTHIGQMTRAMLYENGKAPQKKWRDLKILEAARPYKNRHPSILLIFDAIDQAINKIKNPSSIKRRDYAS